MTFTTALLAFYAVKTFQVFFVATQIYNKPDDDAAPDFANYNGSLLWAPLGKTPYPVANSTYNVQRLPPEYAQPCQAPQYDVVSLPKSGPDFKMTKTNKPIFFAQPANEWEKANNGEEPKAASCTQPFDLGWPLVQTCNDINKLVKLKVFAIQLDANFARCTFFPDAGCTAFDDADDDIGACPHLLFRRGVLRLTREKRNPVLCCRVICPTPYMDNCPTPYMDNSPSPSPFTPGKLYPSRNPENDALTNNNFLIQQNSPPFQNNAAPLTTDTQTQSFQTLDDLLTCRDPATATSGKVSSCAQLKNTTFIAEIGLKDCSFQTDNTCSITNTLRPNSLFSIDDCLVMSNQICPGTNIVARSSAKPADIHAVCSAAGIVPKQPSNYSFQVNYLPILLCCRAVCSSFQQIVAEIPSTSDRSIWAPAPDIAMSNSSTADNQVNLTIPTPDLQSSLQINTASLGQNRPKKLAIGAGMNQNQSVAPPY